MKTPHKKRFKTNGPLISIIVAVKNGAKTLERCIKSVFEQNYPFKELIIIDGFSQDGTCDIIKSYEDRIAYWESSQDDGIADAWNKGIRKAKGQWLLFLGADDFIWKPDGLCRIAPVLNRVYPAYKVVYGDVVHVQAENIVERRGGHWDRQAFNKYMYISHQGILHHRSLFKHYGYFDTTFSITADYEFLLRVFKSENAFYVPNMVLSALEVGGVSNRLENAVQTPVEALKAQEKNGFGKKSMPLRIDVVKCRGWMATEKIFGKRAAYKLADWYRILIGKPPYFTDKYV